MPDMTGFVMRRNFRRTDEENREINYRNIL